MLSVVHAALCFSKMLSTIIETKVECPHFGRDHFLLRPVTQDLTCPVPGTVTFTMAVPSLARQCLSMLENRLLLGSG